MNFELEQQMVEPVKSWLRKRQDLIKEEFRVPWGYCDIVGCSLDKESISKRIKFNQRKPIGPQSRVQLLWNIPDETTNDSINGNELFRIYEGIIDSDYVRGELECLENRHFIRKSSKGDYQKINGWFPLHKELIAIELKLKDVKRAIQQARAHLTYADDSFVALPRPLAEKISRSKNKKKFLQEGIGLLGVSSTWCQTIIHPSNGERSRERNEVLQVHCVERFWRDYLKSN